MAQASATCPTAVTRLSLIQEKSTNSVFLIGVRSGVNVLVRPTSFRLQVMENLRIPIPRHLPPSVLLISPHRYLSLMNPGVPTSQIPQNLLPSLITSPLTLAVLQMLIPNSRKTAPCQVLTLTRRLMVRGNLLPCHCAPSKTSSAARTTHLTTESQTTVLYFQGFYFSESS
ncbi:hypothetical protein BDR04DRAFT_1227050 [Suillus decipiens]|nr:hypothetical protein BDR04DRAFT_1227050 [Suillus decipiens]